MQKQLGIYDSLASFFRRALCGAASSCYELASLRCPLSANLATDPFGPLASSIDSRVSSSVQRSTQRLARLRTALVPLKHLQQGPQQTNAWKRSTTDLAIVIWINNVACFDPNLWVSYIHIGLTLRIETGRSQHSHT